MRMVKSIKLILIFIFVSCLQQQQTISDANQVAKKFDVDNEPNYLLFEGRTLEIIDININRTSQELTDDVTFTCFYDQVVDDIVFNTLTCDSLPGLSFDTDDGTISWTPGYDNYSSDQNFEFKVIASDGIFSDSDTFMIRLIDQNRAPELPFLVQGQATEESAYALDFYDSTTNLDVDADGDAVFYSCEYEVTPEQYTDISAGQISAINALRSLVDSSLTQDQYDANYETLLTYVSGFTTTTAAVWFACTTLDGFTFNSLTGGLSWTPNKNDQNDDKVYRFRITATDGQDSDINYYTVYVTDINTPVEITQFSEMDVYSFSDVIYTYEKTPIEEMRFNAKINLSSTAGTSTTSSCYFDTTVDGEVASTLPCSLIGVTFNSDYDRFEYDGTVTNPSDFYEIELTRASETGIIVVQDLYDLEGTDDDGDEILYTCYYDTTVDATVASTNLCSDIGVDLEVHRGTFNFSPPEVSSDTTYEMKVVASDADTSDETIFSIAVRNKSRFEFKSIDFGANHACALSAAHEVYCWGDNTYGQLGTGDNITRRFPLKLTVGNSNAIRFKSLKTFADHTCALSFQGDLYCWGRNEQGQLGNGSTDNANLIQLVEFPASNTNDIVFDYAVGEQHTCVLNNKSLIYCWGDNTYGQLGIGSTPDLLEMGNIAVQLSAFTYRNTFKIDAGANHTCAQTGDNQLFCWGRNDSGQLGDNSTDDRDIAVLTSTIASGPTDVAVYKFTVGENHTCVTDTSLQSYCTGANASGQLGDGSTTDRDELTSTSTSFEALDIQAGANHTCLYSNASEEIRCFGEGLNGQLGNGATADSSTGVAVTGFSRLRRMFVGYETNCVLEETGMSCWGQGDDYQFLDGLTSDNSSPATISLEGLGYTEDYITSVNLGERACYTKMSGEAFCTELASDINSDLTKKFNLFPPINDSYFSKILDFVIPGSSNGVASYINRKNEIKSYGANDSDYWDGSGSGFINFFGTPVTNTPVLRDIAMGSEHICYIFDDLEYVCSGDNTNSELGDGGTTNDYNLIDGSGSAIRFQKIVNGKDHTCGLDLEGVIHCWGLGPEIGQGAAGDEDTPSAIDTTDFPNLYFIDVFAGDDMTCGISDLRELYCFGDFYNTDAVNEISLAKKVYFKDVQISATHFCAISYDGETYCWGDNTSGQVGNGSTVTQSFPTRISLNSSPINKYFAVSVNGQNSCAIDFQGLLYCWGDNGSLMRFTNLVEDQDYLSPQLFVPENQ